MGVGGFIGIESWVYSLFDWKNVHSLLVSQFEVLLMSCLTIVGFVWKNTANMWDLAHR